MSDYFISIIKTTLMILFFSSSTALAQESIGQAHVDNLPFARAAQTIGVLNTDLSSDITPIRFSIGDVNYLVPRNYISQMTNYQGGPQTMVTLNVTYPGFKPLTEETRKCFESRAVAVEPGPGCVLISFWIEGGYRPDVVNESFQNERRLFHSQIPKSGPNGFEVYEIGPLQTPNRVYRKKLSGHELEIDCDFQASQNHEAVCSNFGELLPNGNKVSYMLDSSRLDDAETIDNGIRSLIRSFNVPGNAR